MKMKSVLTTLMLFFLLSSFTDDSGVLEGYATYYHNKYEGRLTSTDERFHQKGYTAASNYFPLNTMVKVTNEDGISIVVRINDRMAKWTERKNRIIDLTTHCAKILGFYGMGMTRVKVEKYLPYKDTAIIFNIQ